MASSSSSISLAPDNSNGICVDLCGTDEQNPTTDPSVQLLLPNPESDAKGSNVIDLCDDDDDDDNDKDHNGQFVMKVGESRKRKRQSSSSSSSAVVVVVDSAIEIDLEDSKPAAVVAGSNNNNNNNAPNSVKDVEEASYKQALGPIRMAVIPAYEGQAHAFGKSPVGTLIKRKFRKELMEYQLNLPINVCSSIFVRTTESRLDLVRALITGPEDTPYANGCFFFDFYLNDYPTSPPKASFLTTAGGTVRFNPNLYDNGKVCLSLLGTWSGPGWIPNQSTLLQVLVSIQGLILGVTEPYFNEPGLEAIRHLKHGKQQSKTYNVNIRRFTLLHAMNAYLVQLLGKNNNNSCSSRNHQQPPPPFGFPEFEQVLILHFCQRQPAIEKQLTEWIQEDASLQVYANQVQTHLRELIQRHTDTKKPVVQDIFCLDSL